jgi:hypothetical protein
MKKINKLLFLFALSAGVITTSCSTDDNTGDSLVNFTSPSVTVAGDTGNDVTVGTSLIDPSDGYSVMVTATIAEPVAASIYIPLVQTGGTLSSDYVELGTIALTAGATSASAMVTVWDDPTLMGERTVMVGAENTGNANLNDFSMTITVVTDALDMELDWSGSVMVGPNTYNFCDMDFDLLVYDSMGNDMGLYDAATGACPEYLTVDSSLPDGVYTLVVDLYDNPFSALSLGVDVPVTLNYAGADNGSITTNNYTTNTAGGTFDIATVTKSGYILTVN